MFRNKLFLAGITRSIVRCQEPLQLLHMDVFVGGSFNLQSVVGCLCFLILYDGYSRFAHIEYLEERTRLH